MEIGENILGREGAVLENASECHVPGPGIRFWCLMYVNMVGVGAEL